MRACSSRRFRGLVRGAPALLALSLLTGGDAHAFVWPNVPETIAKTLATGDVSDRRIAAERLKELPADVAKPLVLKAMADADPEVMVRAAQAAVAHRLPNAGDLVVSWLNQSDSKLRRAAADVIRAAPTDRSVLALGRVLSDPDPSVRLAAAAAMGASALPEAVTPLLGHLDDPTPEVRAQVATALGRIGDSRAALPLIGRVQDQILEVRRAAARALGEIGDKRASTALTLALRDNAQEVRIEAVTALGKLRADDATGVIAGLLTADDGSSLGGLAAPYPRYGYQPANRSGEVYTAAIRALGLIGSEAAIKALVNQLEAADPGAARSEVRDALVQIGKPAVRELVGTVTGGASRPAQNAALVLGQLGAKEGIEAISKAMQRGTIPVKIGLKALENVGTVAALPLVLEYLSDGDPSVRKLAAKTAAALLDPAQGDGRAVDPAVKSLKDPLVPIDEKVELVRMLGRTGSPRGQAALVTLVKAKNRQLRVAALEALGASGADASKAAKEPAKDEKGKDEKDRKDVQKEVDAALLEAVSDDAEDVRLAAAIALSKAGSGDVASKLLEMLVVSANQDRGALGIALSGVLSRSTDDGVAESVRKAFAGAPDAARDALLEGLARSKAKASLAALEQLSGERSTVDDRRKVAEVLEAKEGATALLRKLAKDAAPSVRAAALWSLGHRGEAADAALASAGLKDPDVTVAANAIAALGRLAARHGKGAEVGPSLCAALGDGRHQVRANALVSLRLAAWDCGGATERDLLARDVSEEVRLAAAGAVARIAAAGVREEPKAPEPPKEEPKADGKDASKDVKKDAKPVASAQDAAKRSLRRCASDDRSATVARRCGVLWTALGAPAPAEAAAPAPTHELVVFVVPEGASVPVARGAFALVRPDGLIHMGLADRRGAMLDATVPAGEVRLTSPLPLLK